MSENIKELKAALRRDVKARLRQISESVRRESDARILQLIQSQLIWRQSQIILFYAAMPEELNLWPLLEIALGLGKKVCLPRYLPASDTYEAAGVKNLVDDLAPGKLNILEPLAACPSLPLHEPDLIFVPGLCFDGKGHRLGRGRGYYDRLLSGTQGRRCGVAFESQVLENIPFEPHDIRVDFIVTPQRWRAVDQR